MARGKKPWKSAKNDTVTHLSFWMATEQNAQLTVESSTSTKCRDGGTGRRSGLKIRRPSGLGGSTPPPGTNLFNQLTEEGGLAAISSASDCNCRVTVSLRTSSFRTASSKSLSLTML